MAQAFNLTAQINLRAPGNLKPVVDTIRRELGSVTADVKVKIDPKSAKSVDAVTRKLQTMNSILVTSTKNTNNLNASLQALSASLSRTSSASTKINTTLTNNASNAAAAAKNLKAASSQMEEFGRQAFLATKRFAAFSIVTVGIYGLINAVNSGLKAFINFDKELVRLQQVTGKGAIGLAGLEKEIRNLAGTLGVSSEKLTDVATTLAQAGLSAEDTRVALAALAKTDLAPSFDDIKETTEGAIAAMRQFGIQAKDLEKSLGSINAVAAAFAVESADLITAIQRTGGVFASASKGVSQGSDALNEFIAIFTSVRATTRESAETIATGLRTIFTRIQRSKTIDELKRFGVELRDLEGKFVGPFEAVKRLSAALNQLDPRSGEFAGIVEELGGFRQIGKVIPLIQQFATAQEALKVAQKGQNSIADAVTTAQKSLAVQIAKVREQFLSLIAAVGKSNTFQIFLKTVLSLTSGLISLASAFKPILPFIAILGTIKGIGAITQFVSGFAGGFSKGGGSKSVGSTVASKVTGSDQKDKTAATAKAAQATIDNTSALVKLTTSVDSLSSKLDSAITSINANTAALGGSGGTTLNSGGKVMGFARGGVVPGSGNRDTVPAMLQPGEFVIRKKAVETIGTDQLYSMNKYAKGGKAYYGAKQRKVTFEAGVGPSPFDSPKQKTDYYSLESGSGFKAGEFDMLVQYAKTNDFSLDEFASYIEKRKQQKLNRYADGGYVKKKLPGAEAALQEQAVSYNGINDLKINNSGKGAIRGYMFENYVGQKYGLNAPDQKFPDIPDASPTILKQLGLSRSKGSKGAPIKHVELKYRSGLQPEFQAPFTEENTAVVYAIEKKLGGKIQKFMAGGVAELSEKQTETLSGTELAALAQSLGGASNIRGAVGGQDVVKKRLSEVEGSTPATWKKLFDKRFLESDDSIPFRSVAQELLELAESKRAKRVFSEEEKVNAIRVGLAGLFPFDVNTETYEEIGDKILQIQTRTLPKSKAPEIAKIRQEIDEAIGRGTKALYGKDPLTLNDPTKEALGLGNLEGYMIEAILARAGANPGRLDDRSVDFPTGLGQAASLFGLDPNIPTEIKRDVKGGYSKAKANFRNYFSKMAAGGLVKLYHGSNSGADDAALKSFQENGILSNIASGYGQGSGFYAWSDKASAMRHAQAIINPRGMLTGANNGGKKMIVELTETLNPKNWDLDYEIQSGDIGNYIYDNFDKMQELLSKTKGINLGEGFSNFSLLSKHPELTNEWTGDKIKKVDVGFEEILSDYGKYDSRDTSKKATIDNRMGDLRNGVLVSKLVQSLRTVDPTILDSLEQEIFDNLKPGTALKYVGSAPLKPSNIELFAKGGGISSQDTVPALLTPGEFVINKKAASRIGYGQLNKLNQADKIQGYNKGGYVGIRKFALGGLTPEQQELVRFRSEQAGISPDQFIKELRKELFAAFKELKNIAPKQKELRAFSIESKEKIKNIKASGADPAEQAKQLQGIKEALIGKIQEIDPKLGTAELEKRASDLMNGLEAGLNINDIISSSTELNDIFNKTVLDQDAYRDALVKLSEATGLTLNSMEELVSGLDIARDQLSEQMQAQYGEFGRLFPKLAESFGKTGFGKSLNNLASSLDGDKLANAIGDKFKFLGSGISEGISSKLKDVFSVPGGVPALLGVAATTLGSVAQNFAGNNAYGQAAAGALTTGGAYASQGAIIGSIFGPPGALAGAVLGGIVGAFQGAAEAFQRTQLANYLDKLSKSSAELDDAFKQLREDLNYENLGEAEKKLGNFADMASGLRGLSASNQGFSGYLPVGFGGISSEVQAEALATEISSRVRANEGASELSQNRLRTLSDAEIDRRVSRNQDSNTSVDEIYNTSTAVDELTRSILKSRGAIIGDTESIDDYTVRAGEMNRVNIEAARATALQEAAINAYVARRKQEGATDKSVNEELTNSRQEVINKGKQYIAEQQKAQEKAEQQARAIKAVTLQQEKLLDVYNRLGGALDKLLMQMDENIRQTDAYTNSLSGNAKVIGPNRNEEDVLRNYSRYSMAEVQASAGRVSNLLGGGQDANDLTGSVVAAKVVRDQLPALLRENEGRGADDAIAALETQFQNLGLGGSEAIKEALKDIEKELGTQEGGIIAGDVTGKEIVEKLSTTLQAGAEASVKVLETFNEGVAKAGEELNKYNDALSKADDYFRKANSIRINSELELRKVLGKRVSLGDQSRAFNEEIRSLTRGIVPGGTTDPNLIGDFIRAESERRRQDVAANSGNLPGAGGTQAAVQSAKELALRQAESARKINDASKALNELANNAEIASNALQKIQENQRLAGASTSYLRKVMTSSSDELRDMNKDLNAYSAVMSGTAGRGDYNSLEFRQQAYRGFDAIQSLMPESMANQMQARMTRQMLQQTNPQMLGQTAYINTEGKAVSIEESLKLAETGVNTDTQALINEYQKATQTQIDANNALGNLQLGAAQSHYQQMESLFAQLNTNLSNLMQEIRDSVKRDAAALRRPVDQKGELKDRGIPDSAGTVRPGESADTSSYTTYSGVALTGLLAGAGYYGYRRNSANQRRRRSDIAAHRRSVEARSRRRGMSDVDSQLRGDEFERRVAERRRRNTSSWLPFGLGGRKSSSRSRPSTRRRRGGASGLKGELLSTGLNFGADLLASGFAASQASSTSEAMDMSMVDSVINVQNATINIGSADGIMQNEETNDGGGFGSVLTDMALYEAQGRLMDRLTKPKISDDALSAARKTAATSGDDVAKSASRAVANVGDDAAKAATRVVATTGDDVARYAGSAFKLLQKGGTKGGIVGGLALSAIDLGVESAGGREAVFGKTGGQIYGTGSNAGLAGASAAAMPLTLGLDAAMTAGEFIYDPKAKLRSYDDQGQQTLSDMSTKQDILKEQLGGTAGASLGYLWQSVDEAALVFQRPIDSIIKFDYAVLQMLGGFADLTTSTLSLQKAQEDARKYKYQYDEQTGDVTKIARSPDDAFSKISGAEFTFANTQAMEEAALIKTQNAQTSGISYQDYLKSSGRELFDYQKGMSDEQLYAEEQKRIQSNIEAANTSKRKATSGWFASGADTPEYLAAVAQKREELLAKDTNLVAASQEAAQSEDYTNIYGPALPTPQNDALTAAIAGDLGETTSDEVVSSQMDMLNALTLNTESLNALTNNIGLLKSLGGGILPPVMSAPSSLDQGVPTMDELLNQSAYNPATEAAFQDMTLPQPVPISTPSVDYGQALQEVIKEASTNGTGYASRGFDLSPQRIKTEENKTIPSDFSKTGQPGNITPYDKLMPAISKDISTDVGSSQLTKILGDFSINIPEFTNSVSMFGNAVNVFSKIFQNNSTENNENNNLSLDNKSIQALQGFSVSVAAFGSYVTSLSKLSIPSKIEIVGKYTFDVNISGAAAFEEMKIELTKELTDLFAEQISDLNKDLYGKTGGQMGKVTPSRTNVRNQ